MATNQTRKSRDGTKLVGNYVWLPKEDDTRAAKVSRKSKPHISKHRVIVHAVAIGLDEMGIGK